MRCLEKHLLFFNWSWWRWWWFMMIHDSWFMIHDSWWFLMMMIAIAPYFRKKKIGPDLDVLMRSLKPFARCAARRRWCRWVTVRVMFQWLFTFPCLQIKRYFLTFRFAVDWFIFFCICLLYIFIYIYQKGSTETPECSMGQTTSLEMPALVFFQECVRSGRSTPICSLC